MWNKDSELEIRRQTATSLYYRRSKLIQESFLCLSVPVFDKLWGPSNRFQCWHFSTFHPIKVCCIVPQSIIHMRSRVQKYSHIIFSTNSVFSFNWNPRGRMNIWMSGRHLATWQDFKRSPLPFISSLLASRTLCPARGPARWDAEGSFTSLVANIAATFSFCRFIRHNIRRTHLLATREAM